MSENRRSIQQTTEQKRAAKAWDDVKGISKGMAETYSTQARRLPSLIQVNGLGQTLAFFRSKPDNQAMKAIYGHLSGWVMGQMGQEEGDLLSAVTRWQSDVYRRATAEALAYALWLRRFAEAEAWNADEGEGS
jgi:CRISPR-associated protein Cmr5